MAAKADEMTRKMSEGSASPQDRGGAGMPKKGDAFRCDVCGMAIEVTADCRCAGAEHAEFICCGQDMRKA
jgi:hypothetical protein